MAKKYPFEATAVCAGDRQFMPGDKLSLAADEASELLAAQSVRPLDPKTPKSFFPTGVKNTALPSNGGASAEKPGKPTAEKTEGKQEGKPAEGGAPGGDEPKPES